MDFLLNPWFEIMLSVTVEMMPCVFLMLLVTTSEMSLYVGATILHIISNEPINDDDSTTDGTLRIASSTLPCWERLQ